MQIMQVVKNNDLFVNDTSREFIRVDEEFETLMDF